MADSLLTGPGRAAVALSVPLPRIVIRIGALVLLAAVPLAILQLLPIPRETRWWRAVFDAGHAPLFGALAIVLLAISLSIPVWKERGRGLHYLAAFAGAVVLGAMSEAFQLTGARNASVWDLLRNVAGSAAFLAFVATFDAELQPRLVSPSLPVKGLLRVGAAVLLGVAFVPVAATGVAYLSRNAAFPRICSFQSYWESFFLETSVLELTLSYLPEELQGDAPDNLVGRLEFAAGPGNRLMLVEPFPDWSGHDTLAFELYSPLDRPVNLGLRIDDADHDTTHRDRFNLRIRVTPGRNEIRVPLEDVREAPATRQMAMDRIRKVVLFAGAPETPFLLYVDDFRLE